MPARRLCLLIGLALMLALGWGAARTARADTFVQLFSSRMGHLKTEASVRVFWQPSVGVMNQDAVFSPMRTKFDFMTPLAQNKRFEAAMFLDAAYTRVDSQAVLPDTNRAFPSDLWKLGAGGFYRRKLNQTWIISAMAKIGSSSDKPFYTWEETNISAFGIARMAMGRDQAWLFMLAYSKNSDFLAGAPIPGVAWSYQPNRELMVLLGAPMCVLAMHPNPQSTLSLFWLFPTQSGPAPPSAPASPGKSLWPFTGSTTTTIWQTGPTTTTSF